jgi:hypothetical protein
VTSAERTIPTVTAAVDQTLACETDRHHRCHSTILSLTSAHGAACGCACHGLDDLTTGASLGAPPRPRRQGARLIHPTTT